ncbi:hypothetical protein RHMOL_Rhmol09G0093200 [Rhododendron molle]|uniref:Uncharacterized protein n=1 Tax=Rhododendron molle TaxID=49168 RepID=A0ACC0MDE6_RHOML|nr:hypothetical protein RHMOL_Rhmol09G0093200 [Rhododendron molle]
MCLLAACLLVHSTGHASSALVSIAVQIEARKDVVPMVLAETLIGLDRVCSGETETFGGSPLLLQVGFSLSSPFSGFSCILILPRRLAWLSTVSYLFSFFLQIWLCDKVNVLTIPPGNWAYEARLLSQQCIEFADRRVSEWVDFFRHRRAGTISWRCSWLDFPPMTVHFMGPQWVVLAGLEALPSTYLIGFSASLV